MLAVQEDLYRGGIGDSQSAIVKLKEGRVQDVKREELTHPRIVHFYKQAHLLFRKLGEKQYEDLIRRLRRIGNVSDLEVYLPTFEEDYKTGLMDSGYGSEYAAQEGHDISKVVRKLWYRMKTNFDEIEGIHEKRVAYVQALGKFLYDDNSIRQRVKLMLMIKDVAAGTDGWLSDIDMVFGIDVKNNTRARGVGLNTIAPAIRAFESTYDIGYPPDTAHLDWENQTYSIRWLRSVAREPPSPEYIFDGFRSNTQTRNYLAENVFGSRDGVRMSVPIYSITDKSLYEKLMDDFTQSKRSRSTQQSPEGIQMKLPFNV